MPAGPFPLPSGANPWITRHNGANHVVVARAEARSTVSELKLVRARELKEAGESFPVVIPPRLRGNLRDVRIQIFVSESALSISLGFDRYEY